jgi:hypothetical protein
MKNSIKREQSEQIRSAERENFSPKGKISNEQIIQSARRQRQSVHNQMDVEPWSSRPRKIRGLAAVIAIAASLVSFIAGYGIHANLQPTDVQQPLAQVVEVQHDTIMQTEILRDTVYQTRTVTRYVEKQIAQSAPSSSESAVDLELPAEQMACSMLCDNIPYDLLAQP